MRLIPSNSRPDRTPLPGIQFVKLDKGSFSLIRSVEAEGRGSRWTDGMLREELSHGHGFHFGARDASGTRLSAYALCRLFAGELHIHRLCTRPAERRQGYATSLLSHVFDAARRRGAQRAFLEVSASNRTALSLYRRLGFTVDAERKKYCADGKDAYKMSQGIRALDKMKREPREGR